MFTVTLTTATGYTFNNGFTSLAEARKFIALAALALLPGERIELKKEG